jgi:hypothetical protein
MARPMRSSKPQPPSARPFMRVFRLRTTVKTRRCSFANCVSTANGAIGKSPATMLTWESPAQRKSGLNWIACCPTRITDDSMPRSSGALTASRAPFPTVDQTNREDPVPSQLPAEKSDSREPTSPAATTLSLGSAELAER